jgi:transposase
MVGKRRKYTPEFKVDAVKMVVDRGLTVAEAARNLGIDRTLLADWKRSFEGGGLSAFPGNGRRQPEDEAIRLLKKELSQTREERDILKKALAYFAKEPK